MKIILFIDNLGSGGAQRQIVNLAILFKNNGHSVKILTYGDSNFFKPILVKYSITVKTIKSDKILNRILLVRKYLRNSGQDLVISFLDTPNFLACLSSVGGRKWKLISSERSAKLSSFRTIKGKIFKWFIRYSDSIVCNSYNAQKMWGNECPKYKNKLTTIYNPIFFDTDHVQDTRVSNEYTRFVVVASYQYIKNMNGLIEAVRLLEDYYQKKIRIEWYGRIEVTKGNTKAYDDAVTKIKEYNLSNISLYGETDDIKNIMQDSDFVCLFSEVEGLPNVICEAMMLGKPVIMSKVSDYSTLIDENNGFLCDADNPLSIKNVLIDAIRTDYNTRVKMGKSSKQKAELLFDKDVVFQKWLSVINKINK